MATIKIVLEFATDRDLSEDELDQIKSNIDLQVREPVDHDNEDVDYSAWLYQPASAEVLDNRVFATAKTPSKYEHYLVEYEVVKE